VSKSHLDLASSLVKQLVRDLELAMGINPFLQLNLTGA